MRILAVQRSADQPVLILADRPPVHYRIASEGGMPDGGYPN
jgi:hypothetical protein